MVIAFATILHDPFMFHRGPISYDTELPRYQSGHHRLKGIGFESYPPSTTRARFMVHADPLVEGTSYDSDLDFFEGDPTPHDPFGGKPPVKQEAQVPRNARRRIVDVEKHTEKVLRGEVKGGGDDPQKKGGDKERKAKGRNSPVPLEEAKNEECSPVPEFALPGAMVLLAIATPIILLIAVFIVTLLLKIETPRVD